MKQVIEARKERKRAAATTIQSISRGSEVRKITKFGVGDDIELAKAVKLKLEEHSLTLSPHDYLPRPAFHKLQFKEVVSKMQI